jgi:hypothetical protein
LDPAGGSEPTGILTHHQVHDSETWRFLAFFLRCTTCHAAVRWLPAGQVFDLDQRGQA